MISGNLTISFIDDMENCLEGFVMWFFDTSTADIMALAKINAVIWNNSLYVKSTFSRSIVPIKGPIINPETKKPANLPMFFTLSLFSLTFAIIDSQGGQKNPWAIPVKILKPIISGTDWAVDNKKMDVEFSSTPKDKR